MLTAGVIYMTMERAKAVVSLLRDIRHIAPACVIAIIVLTTVFQLFVVKAAIVSYRPAFRSDLVVDPATFGVTGFAQPTPRCMGRSCRWDFWLRMKLALVSVPGWLPTGERAGPRGFMYRYDVLFFHLGIVPSLLLVVSLVSGHRRRVRAAWLAFAAVMFLVALQQSGVYFGLYHVPFFNLFRSYALYLSFTVFALLVVSAFGFDALIAATPPVRRALVNRAIRVMIVAGVAAAGCFLWLVYLTPGSLQLLRRVLEYVVLDVGVLAASLWGLRRLSRGDATTALAAGVLGLLVASQVLYTAGVYRILGTPAKRMMARMNIQVEERNLLSAESIRPDRFHRKACTMFAQCYLSDGPSASLRLDLEGSFLRSRESVIYQAEIAPSAAMALLGISHPVYWSSEELREYDDFTEVVQTLNDAGEGVHEFLRRVTFVRAGDGARRGRRPENSHPELIRLEREADRTRIAYRSSGAFYLNASVTYDKGWRASVGGRPLEIHRGNFDGLVVEVPPGQHVVEFRYFSWSARLFFLTRFLQLAAAVAATTCLALSVGRKQGEA